MQVNIMKSAMRSGLFLGILFSLNFLMSIPSGFITRFLTYVIIGVIIVATYRLTIQFRENELGGYINYGRAFLFILLSFFYAALISSLVKFVYFQFINPDYLSNLFNESMLMMEKMGLPIDSSVEESMEKLLKPASFALQYIWVNMLAGAFVGLIMSAFVKKEKSIFDQE